MLSFAFLNGDLITGLGLCLIKVVPNNVKPVKLISKWNFTVPPPTTIPKEILYP